MRKEEFLKPINSELMGNSGIKASKPQKNHIETFKTGTTTVGLTCKDAIILGTDKRATMSYFVASKTAEKLHKIQDHLWMTIAGSVADCLYLVDILRAETAIYQLKHDNRPIKVQSAGKLLSNTNKSTISWKIVIKYIISE